VFLFIIILGGLGYEIGYQNIAATRVYTDLKNDLEAVKSANICIYTKTTHDDSVAYSVGASGVIFSKDSSGYYALTAYHVVNKKNSEFLVMTVKDPTLIEYRENHPGMKLSSSYEYYDTLSAAQVIYTNEDCDLAIVYFKSEQELKCASIASENPKKGEKIVCVGTYADKLEYFVESYGKVKQNNTSTFHTEDGTSDSQVLRHSAFEVEGFSGSGVFDQNMEIVGMNIGGTKNIFRRFSYGVMIPCEQINECITESGILE
jgi:S1-C subfamily serine protease